jgi:hypothetical protein
MVARLGSLTSSPPLSSKMGPKISMTSLGEGWAVPAVSEEEGAQKAPQQPMEEVGAQKVPQQLTEEVAEEGAQKAPQQPTEEGAEEGAISAAPEAEAAEAEAALTGIRRQCSLPVSTHEPTPHALLGKKVPTRRPLPPVGNVLRLWA